MTVLLPPVSPPYCSVPEFEASQYLVTNGEFLEFVESGGYQNKDLWTEEGTVQSLFGKPRNFQTSGEGGVGF